jgi:hypothetical protein
MTSHAVCEATRTRTETRRAAPAPDATQPAGPCSRTVSVGESSSDRRFASPLGWGGEAVASPPAAVGTMGSTLEVLIQRLWEGLWDAGGTPCPICRGQLRLQDGKGLCDTCGSALS